MAATDTNPISLDLQSPLNFMFTIKRAPATSYFCQDVKIPNVSLPAVKVPSPSLTVPMIGDHVVYEPLSLTFKVDDNLQNWLEMYNWLKAIGNPENTSQNYITLENNKNYSGYGIYSDLQLFILDSQKNPTYLFTFERCSPTFLSGPHFESTDNSIPYINSTVNLSYTKFKISLP
jgi:hypothetical protein